MQGISVFSGGKCSEAVFSVEGSSFFSGGKCREAVFSVEESSVFSGRKQCFQWREAMFSVEGSSVFSRGKCTKQCFQGREVQGSCVFSGGRQCFPRRKAVFQLREAMLSVQRSSDVLPVHAYPGSGRRLCVTSESGAAGGATRGTSTDPAARQAAASGETSHPVAAASQC